jgi:L-threonylcarbamoyladenylate synthase
MQKEIESAIEVLKQGGIILYPTDTIWGIGCDATNPDAVEKIIKLKQRNNKSFIVLVDNINELGKYIKDVPDIAYDLIEVSDKPLTVILNGAKNLASNVINKDGSVGIRVVNHPFCQQLIRKFRKPIVSTSANVSGKSSPMSFDEIDNQIKSGVDYIVDIDKQKKSSSVSSIVMIGEGSVINIVRK